MLESKDYCDYDTCVALKELGYKVPTSAYYIPNNNQLIFVSNPFRGGYVIDCFYSHNSLPKDVMTANYIDAPTLWEAQKWLREEKDIDLAVYSGKGKDNDRIWVCNFVMEKTVYQLTHEGIVVKTFSSYEEALSEGIKEAVKILKDGIRE